MTFTNEITSYPSRSLTGRNLWAIRHLWLLALSLMGLAASPTVAGAQEPQTIPQAIEQVLAITAGKPEVQTRARATEAMRIVHNRVAVNNDGWGTVTQTVSPNSDLALRDKALEAVREGGRVDPEQYAWDQRNGRCAEHAYLVQRILWGAGEGCVILTNSHHTFPAVGLAPNADADIPWTWGPNAVVADSWENKVVPAVDTWNDASYFNGGRDSVYNSRQGRIPTRAMLEAFNLRGPDFIWQYRDIYQHLLDRYQQIPESVRNDGPLVRSLPRDSNSQTDDTSSNATSSLPYNPLDLIGLSQSTNLPPGADQPWQRSQPAAGSGSDLSPQTPSPSSSPGSASTPSSRKGNGGNPPGGNTPATQSNSQTARPTAGTTPQRNQTPPRGTTSSVANPAGASRTGSGSASSPTTISSPTPSSNPTGATHTPVHSSGSIVDMQTTPSAAPSPARPTQAPTSQSASRPAPTTQTAQTTPNPTQSIANRPATASASRTPTAPTVSQQSRPQTTQRMAPTSNASRPMATASRGTSRRK
jgi:hypothetical protein